MEGYPLATEYASLSRKAREMILKIYHSLSLILSNNLNRKVSICLRIFGLVAVIYTVFWYGTMAYFKSVIQELRDNPTNLGFTASYEKIEITGFPVKFRITINNPQLQASLHKTKSQNNKEWIWRGKLAVVEIKPWNFNIFRINLSGLNKVSFINAETAYDFISKAKLIRIDAKISGSQIEELYFKANKLNISENFSGKEIFIDKALFNTQQVQQDSNSCSGIAENPSRIIRVKLKDILLPREFGKFLDSRLDKIFMDLKVSKNLRPVFNLNNLTTWRDAGGIIDIESFEGISGRLKIYGSGTLALDQKLQPLLAVAANFEGIMPLVDKLKLVGFINSRTALLAKFVLSGISRRSANGRKSVSLPLTIQDRRLSIGPAQLLTLPFINWGKGTLINRSKIDVN